MKTEGEILDTIDGVFRQVKNVNGGFLTIFSNELLGGKQKVNWMQLYAKVIKRYHV
jgi:hypothetical protein